MSRSSPSTGSGHRCHRADGLEGRWAVRLLLAYSVLMCSCAGSAGNAMPEGDGSVSAACGDASGNTKDYFRPQLSTRYGVLMRVKAEMIRPKERTKLPSPSKIKIIERNGEKVDPPIVLCWSRTPPGVHEEEQEIEDGATFEAIGYECVIMEGMPEGIENFEELEGTTDYAYSGWNEWKVFVGMYVTQSD